MTTATVTQTDTISAADVGWSVPLSFNDFNPSLGTPLTVKVGVVGTVTGAIAIENLGATTATVNVSLPGSVAVTGGPDHTLLTSVNVDPTQSIQLGAYDGATDFAGGSGTIVTGIASTGSAASAYTPGTAGAVPFVGTGTYDLAATSAATSSVAGNGNLLAVTHAEAGASVSLEYDYQPAASGGGNSGSTSGSTDAGFTSTYNLGGPIVVYRTTVAQTFVIDDQTTGFTTTIAAQQFNPALGTLSSVNITVISDINGGFAAENLSSAAGPVSMTDTVNLGLMLPNGTVVTTPQPSIGSTTTLGAYDGTIDFAGTSGFLHGGLTATQRSDVSLDAIGTNLSALVGTDTVALPVSATSASLVTGPADLESELRTLAGAEVVISYVYAVTLPEPLLEPIAVAPSAPPTITGASAGEAITGPGTIAPFASVVITDPDPGLTESVVITLSDPGHGRLTNLGGGSYNATLGVYVDTGSADSVTAALQGLHFTPAQAAPGHTVTTSFTIDDTNSVGLEAKDGSTSVVVTGGTTTPAVTNLTAVADPLAALTAPRPTITTGAVFFSPTITGTIPNQPVTDQATITPFARVVIADPGAGQTETVTLTLSTAANGSLGNLGGGSYNATTGVYTDVGTAAAVTTALQALVFTPAPHQVAPTQTVTTTFSILDTDTAGATATDAATSVVATATGTIPANQVVLHGAAAQYRIANDSGTLYVQDTIAGRDGTQVLPGVTEAVFTNGTGLFDPTGTAEDVARLYQAALNRVPDAGGLNAWTTQIDSGTVSLTDVAGSFAASPEFIQDYGALTDAGFIQQFYINALGRPEDQAGAQYWAGVLASGTSRGAVTLAFAESPENKARTASTAGDTDNAATYRLYQAAFGRAPDAAGLSYWSNMLINGTTPGQIAQDFVGSTEFQADYGQMTPRDFTAALYQNILHRAADPGGMQYWTTALQGGASQAAMVAGFADSLENRLQTAAATHANWVLIAS